MDTKQNQNPDLERLRMVMLLAREDAKIADDKYLLAREAYHVAEIREKEITEMAESAGVDLPETCIECGEKCSKTERTICLSELDKLQSSEE